MAEPAWDEIAMPRADWLAFRRSHVGGSDAAAVMGISPWVSPYRVWAEKSGLAEPDDISDRPRVEWGVRLEHDVAVKFSECHPDLVLRVPEVPDMVTVIVPRDRPWAMATLDGVAYDGEGGHPSVLEVKTAHFPTARQWDDGVPAHYLAQVNHYLSVTGWGRAHVAVLIDGWDYREFTVERDEADVACVSEAVDSFWHDHVEAGVPPEATGPDAATLLEVHREPDGGYRDGTPLQLELVEEWREAASRASRARREADDLAARLRQEIGDAGGLLFPEGRLTWTRSTSSRLDAGALREDDPATYDRYCRDVATQRLTWKGDE